MSAAADFIQGTLDALRAQVADLTAQRDRAELHQKTATEAAHALLERAEKAEAECAVFRQVLCDLCESVKAGEPDTLAAFGMLTQQTCAEPLLKAIRGAVQALESTLPLASGWVDDHRRSESCRAYVWDGRLALSDLRQWAGEKARLKKNK